MNSFEVGPSPEQQNKELEIEELEAACEVENSEVAETVKFKPEQAIAHERSILERFKGKAREVAGILLFVSALSVGPGTVGETYAQEIKPAVQTEQIEKEKLKSIYSYFRDAQSILGDEEMVNQILNDPFRKGFEELGGQKIKFEPQAIQKMSLILTDEERFPWIEQNEKGEQEIWIFDTFLFDRSVTEAEEEILTVSIPVAGHGKIKKLQVDFSRIFPDSSARKNKSVFDGDYKKLIRPDFKENPNFYQGNTQLLKPEFAVRIKQGSTNEFEFVNPAVAEEASRRLEIFSLFSRGTNVLITIANNRLALQRIREAGEAAGIKEIVESVQHALKWDIYKGFFKE